ncbi:winged helix-turn-helix domain-containing protein [Methanolacinia petrolearia]|uniref:winged helix-turn-helix domain-containing protein n=1 Tax=Methanolacinia petrolearia TaxID=54120 RepID=UPI001CDB45AE|nr:winged helix-turn-helix domain-containing protein [Methanolacinia petrolearia]
MHRARAVGQGETREETREKTREDTSTKILSLISTDPSISMGDMARRIGITQKGIEWQIRKLKDSGRLERVGPKKGGYWKIIGNADE